MRRTINGFVAVAVMLIVCITGISCTKKEEAAKKAAPKLTPEQAKKVEEIKKGAEESKKVVAAKVNGVPITMFQLVGEMNMLARKYADPIRKPDPKLDEKIKREALDRLIFRELALQEATRQGIRVKPEMIDDVIKRIKASVGSEAAYKEYLASREITESGLREQIERSNSFELITAKEIYRKISLNDATLKVEYEKNKEHYRTAGAAPHQMSFGEARPLVERQLKMEVGEKKMKEWEKELKKNAKIEIMNN